MARSCRTRTLRVWRGTLARSARLGRCARTTGFRSSCRATASSRPAGSARTRASAPTTSDGCSPSKVSLSEDLRNELAAIAPRSECDRLAELSGLFHSAGSVHPRGRGGGGGHLHLAEFGGWQRAFAVL